MPDGFTAKDKCFEELAAKPSRFIEFYLTSIQKSTNQLPLHDKLIHDVLQQEQALRGTTNEVDNKQKDKEKDKEKDINTVVQANAAYRQESALASEGIGKTPQPLAHAKDSSTEQRNQAPSLPQDTKTHHTDAANSDLHFLLEAAKARVEFEGSSMESILVKTELLGLAQERIPSCTSSLPVETVDFACKEHRRLLHEKVKLLVFALRVIAPIVKQAHTLFGACAEEAKTKPVVVNNATVKVVQHLEELRYSLQCIDLVVPLTTEPFVQSVIQFVPEQPAAQLKRIPQQISSFYFARTLSQLETLVRLFDKALALSW
jgi:hypothetical protein